MRRLGQTITRYIFWTYGRGSFHYDVMVTMILLFIFAGPQFLDFKDKPTERIPHQTGVVEITPDGNGGFVYRIPAESVDAAARNSVDGLHTALLRVVQPIAGEVEIVRVQEVKDRGGRTQAYQAWVRK